MTEETFQRLCKGDLVSPERIHVAYLGARQIALVRRGGSVTAFKNRCPHAGAPLSGGIVRGGTIECPRHHWEFYLDSGECVDQPLYCLRMYDVREEGGWIWVRERTPEIW